VKLINAGRPASELRPAPVFPSSSHRTTIQPPRVPPKTGNWKLATQNTSALIFAPPTRTAPVLSQQRKAELFLIRIPGQSARRTVVKQAVSRQQSAPSHWHRTTKLTADC
jgi:hypothetical protein